MSNLLEQVSRNVARSHHDDTTASQFDQKLAAVSVIIPTYNRSELLIRSVERVLAQTHPPKQVIIVDDGSTDGTAASVAGFGNEVEYLRKENGGRASAINVALKACHGDYIWIVDDDDLVMPRALERLCRALGSSPNAMFSYGNHVWATGASGKPAADTHGRTNAARATETSLFFDMLRFCHIRQSALLARRTCYDVVGQFDERFVRSQDYELLLRITRRFEGVRVDDVIFIEGDHPGLRGNAAERHTPAERRRWWLKYDSLIFENLYRELDLHEYLPERNPPLPLGPVSQRIALVRRLQVMGCRARWDHCAEDLARLMTEPFASHSLTPRERGWLRDVLSDRLVALSLAKNPESLKTMIMNCRGSIGAQVRYEMFRGMYYTFRREFSWLSFQDRYSFLFALIKLLGRSGFGEHLKRKAGRGVL